MPDGFSPEERRDLLMKLLAGLPEVSGPMPPDRWMHLPEHQREWLSGKSKAELDRLDLLLAVNAKRLDVLMELDEEDVDDLKEAIQFARSLRTVGRFTRMVILTVLSVIGGMLAFRDQFGALWKWVGGKG